MKKLIPLLSLLAVFSALLLRAQEVAPANGSARAPNRPNVILIMMDDLGYGDVGFLNPNSRIKTPNLDRLAASGMVFTDAHTAAGVCTPARYAALTGRYSFRSRLQARILGGYDPRLIEEGRLTLASMLKTQGYTTAAIGKWHLGMTFARRPGTSAPRDPNAGPAPRSVDFSRPVTGGPNAHGFDYFFGIPSSIDIPPYVYLENDRFLAPATRTLRGPRGIRGFGSGRAAADFRHVDVMPALVKKTVEYLAGRGREPARPFFLFFAATGVHNPIVPTPRFVGTSAAGEYGDFVEQMDASVGEILAALKSAGLERDTLVLFTSDNGPAPLTAAVREKFGHASAGPWRGLKASLHEGGHRVPFIASWPAKTQAGSRSAELIGLVDIVATVAELTGHVLPDDAAEDSFSFAPVLTGAAFKSPLRPTLVTQADAATDLAIRRGSLVLLTGRGGRELYDLAVDPGQVNNLASTRTEVVAEMSALLEGIRSGGRETPPRR